MSGGVERMDPYGDGAEPAWVGRGGRARTDHPGEGGFLREIAERYAPEVARDLGVDADRVRDAFRRVSDR